MSTLPAAVGIGGLAGLTIVVADVTAAGVSAHDALSLIREGMAVVVPVAAALWWLGRELKGIRDALKSHGETLAKHTKILENLPCGGKVKTESC